MWKYNNIYSSTSCPYELQPLQLFLFTVGNNIPSFNISGQPSLLYNLLVSFSVEVAHKAPPPGAQPIKNIVSDPCLFLRQYSELGHLH